MYCPDECTWTPSIYAHKTCKMIETMIKPMIEGNDRGKLWGPSMK